MKKVLDWVWDGRNFKRTCCVPPLRIDEETKEVFQGNKKLVIDNYKAIPKRIN